MSHRTEVLPFPGGAFLIGKKPNVHPYHTRLRFRFPGSSAVSFFRCFALLYYSLRTFSLAVFVHRFFFLILRLFSSFSSLDIRFLHLQLYIYVYIYEQVLSLPVKTSVCPSRLSCSVWCSVIRTYIYTYCFCWLFRNHLL